MKFIFLTENGRLHPIASRVRDEKYDVENNPRQVIQSASLVITDKPLVSDMSDKLCMGDSKFSQSLLNPSYHDAILVMNNFHKSKVRSNTSISCWFNGVDFVYPAVISINEDRFMEGDKGMLTDSMGCTLSVCNPNKRAFTETLLKFKDLLRKVSYCGFFSLSCVFNETTVKITKIEPYFKYDLLYAFFEGTQGEIGRALHEIAIGGKKEFKFPEQYTIAIRISIPPYPYSHVKCEKTVLDGVCKENEKHLWLQNTIRKDSGLVSSDGGYGVIASVTARGCSMRECKRRAIRTIENLSIDWMQYRMDVGHSAESTFEQLQKWGWM